VGDLSALDTPENDAPPEAGNASTDPTAPHLPRTVKDAALELLKYGLLEEVHKPNYYRAGLANREAIEKILAPLDLAMRVDDVRGLAYLVVAEGKFESEGAEWSHPLVRRQRLNLEQSLLIAILRQQFVAHEQEAGLGSTETVVALDDLLPQLKIFLGDPGSELQEQKRLRNLLEQLKSHGIVSDVDEQDQVQIRPIIAHLANPGNLQSLLATFRAEARLTTNERSASTDPDPN
jgi:hypothetical protein